MRHLTSFVYSFVGVFFATSGLPALEAFSPTSIGNSPIQSYLPQTSQLLRADYSSQSSPFTNSSWKGRLHSVSQDDEESQQSIRASLTGSHKKNFLSIALIIAATIFASDVVNTTPLTTSLSAFVERISDSGFYQAFSLVFVSEIGDKTFFIAGLLAMKAGKLISFAGSILALAVMTLLSVLIGQIFHAVPEGITQGIPFDDIAAVLAFTFFGVKTLKEASEIKDNDVSGIDEEFADAEEAVEGSETIRQVTAWGKIVSTFGLVFAAEFGDRSFLSTIALSAAQNPVYVASGAIAAHAIATLIAVAGGSYVAKYISERTIGYIGGTLFLIFATTTAIGLF